MIRKVSPPQLSERREQVILPNKARMMIYFYVSFEDWDWETSKSFPPLVPAPLGTPPRPDLATMSAVEYGFNVGIFRLMEIWKDHNISVTVSVSGLAAGKRPETISALAKQGHEIAAHSYHQGVLLPLMDRNQQQDAIRKSIAILENTIGQRPVGWVGPGARANEDTLELLAEEGFLYCCELQDDEIPYHLLINDKALIVIPFRFDGNPTDLRISNPSVVRDPTEGFAYLKGIFDAHYKYAAISPLLLYYGVHPYVSGRPDRAIVLDSFIKYVKSFPDVWIATRREIAEWYKRTMV